MFEFDLPDALLKRLIEVLDGMPGEHLTVENVLSNVEEKQGVYQLFPNNNLVYIGKTDAQAGLRKRLIRHAEKILDRPNLSPQSVTFRAVQILVFTAMDLETGLIQHYTETDRKPKWNGSGFGSNDLGRERDTTRYNEDHFDWIYPIDTTILRHYMETGTYTVASVLGIIKDKVRYTLRFQNGGGNLRVAHPDLRETQIDIANAPQSVDELLRGMVGVLPVGWQATVLPGHVILYQENKAYVSGVAIRK